MCIVFVSRPRENIPFYDRYEKLNILINIVFDCAENKRQYIIRTIHLAHCSATGQRKFCCACTSYHRVEFDNNILLPSYNPPPPPKIRELFQCPSNSHPTEYVSFFKVTGSRDRKVHRKAAILKFFGGSSDFILNIEIPIAQVTVTKNEKLILIFHKKVTVWGV